ncbi:MAG: DUF2213 domain-containing protein [Clostridium sp.]|nr:DUF2213 domain-containing protein [Clostridium sp.]
MLKDKFKTINQALDKKEIDPNGYWYLYDNPITKVGVFPYLGKQISPELEPDKIYYVYRPEEELTRPETMESFKLKPLIDEHEMLGEQFTPAEEKGIHGTLGENVKYNKQKEAVTNNLIVYSEAMKNAIENDKKELSLGYKCKYELTTGEYKGQHYDAIQRDIYLNHIALVAEGRMGHEVRIMDSALAFDTFSEVLKIQQKETDKMAKNLKKRSVMDEDVNIEINQGGEEEQEQIPAVVDEDIDKREVLREADAIAMKPVSEFEGGAEEKFRTLTKKLEELGYNSSETGANDEDPDEEQPAEDEEDKPCGDEDPAEETKKAEDEDEEKKDEEKPVSMDAAIKYLAKKEALIKRIRPLIGDNARYSSMTIPQVVKYACDKLDIKNSYDSLDGYLRAKSQSTVKVSFDSMFKPDEPSATLKAYKLQK